MLDFAPAGPKDNIIWAPLKGSQTTVLSHSWVFEILYHGTRGPGKSDTLLMDFAQFVGRGFGEDWRGVIFRRTYKELQDLIAKSLKWFKKIWPEAKWNGSDSHWSWPTGEKLMFRQYVKKSDYWNYHGHAYPFIGWDELTTWSDLDGYKRLMSCCRSTNPLVPRMYRATTNPYGPGHNVVKHHFELPAKDGVIRRRTYKMEHPVTGEVITEQLCRLAVKGTVYENTILLEADPTYIAKLKAAARNEAELAAWLEGSWDIVAGGMFDDVWNQRWNVIKPFHIPDDWTIYRTHDWGSSAPFSVGWWAISSGSDYVDATGQLRSSVEGDMFRMHEWYGWCGKPNEGLKMLAKDISTQIREIERGFEKFRRHKVRPGPADTSIFDVVNGGSIAADMEKRVRLSDGTTMPGIYWERADKSKGSRIHGWELFRKRLKGAHPQPHPTLAGRYMPRETPGLFVMDCCDQFIRTVPVLPRDEKKQDDLDTSTEDHIADETRYMVLYLTSRASSGRVTGTH